MHLEGSVRPAICLASELVRRGCEVSVISPIMSDDVERRLRAGGITPINLCSRLAAKHLSPSLLWFETWIREAFFRLNSMRVGKDLSMVINFSQVISVPSLVWYLQGSPSIALKDIERELSIGSRIAYNVLKPIIKLADERLISRMGRSSAFVIANSKFCASMYSKFGIEVNDVIYPPIDRQTFHPSASSPASNYVLSYFGKETKFSVVKKIADMGVKIKAFGSKMFIRKDLMEHRNIEFLGRIGTRELVDMYSNALFTLFPFTHEPFGYVPLESMACGTPVLTYDRQGPREYVIDGCTGWLVHTDDELIQKAVELWKEGYPSRMRPNCVEAASKFDERIYIEKWLGFLSSFLETPHQRVGARESQRWVKV